MSIPQYLVLVLKLTPINTVPLNSVFLIPQNQCYPGNTCIFYLDTYLYVGRLDFLYCKSCASLLKKGLLYLGQGRLLCKIVCTYISDNTFKNICLQS